METPEGRATLRLTRRFGAPREEVFDAWTNPDVLRAWWASQPDWDTPSAEVDLRPGGRYRLSMRDTSTGDVHSVVGEYREVRPPERLSYTWTWEGTPEIMRGSEGTLVEVEFAEDGDGTWVTVVHSGFGDAHIRDQHVQGWNACLDKLERQIPVAR